LEVGGKKVIRIRSKRIKNKEDKKAAFQTLDTGKKKPGEETEKGNGRSRKLIHKRKLCGSHKGGEKKFAKGSKKDIHQNFGRGQNEQTLMKG